MLQRKAEYPLKAVYLTSVEQSKPIFPRLFSVIPSVSMSWLSYVQNRKFLREKIAQELWM